jgi:hypothetical protein
LWNKSVPKFHLRKNRNLYNIIFSIFYSTFLGRAERLISARNLEQLLCSQGINHYFSSFTLHQKTLKFFPSRFVTNFFSVLFFSTDQFAKMLMKPVFLISNILKSKKNLFSDDLFSLSEFACQRMIARIFVSTSRIDKIDDFFGARETHWIGRAEDLKNLQSLLQYSHGQPAALKNLRCGPSTVCELSLFWSKIDLFL